MLSGKRKKNSRRISFKRFLLVALYTPTILTMFHLFGNSLAGVPGISNWGTRLNMVVCKQKWPFFYDTFLKIFPTNFFQHCPPNFPTYVHYTHQVSCLSKLPSWGTQEPELGYPTANIEHQPNLIYETFLKIFPTNFF